jgi:O-antigen/teichoic acid export membrane protein
MRWLVALVLPLAIFIPPASDWLSVELLGDARTRLGLILLVPCAALAGVENLHKHAFFGAGLVKPPAMVDLAEQFVRCAAVLGLLLLFPGQYPERAVGLIVAGMICSEIFSSVTITGRYRRTFGTDGSCGKRTFNGEGRKALDRRIFAIALPVGLNAVLGEAISAANAALLPRKLMESGLTRGEAVSQFGVVCGMTLPLLALPTFYLGALNLVLTPRLAKENALGHKGERDRLLGWALGLVTLITLPSMALMALAGPKLGQLVYGQDVGAHMLPLAVVMGMSCYCSVLAAALSGLDRQRTVAAVSVLGGGVQLLATCVLVPLPGVGMGGYVAGATAATGLELLLLWGALRRATGEI